MASFLTKIFGSRNDRLIKQYRRKVAAINKLEPEMKALSDEQLKAKTAEFRQRLADGASLDSLLPEAFAVVREASFRVLGMRHFDVQLIGGMVLNDGKIAEMRTGEGKTLTATLAVYLNALPGKGAHVVTVNDYLASRDAAWMGKVYNFLGMSVGTILSNQPNDQKQAAYAADITYGTNNEFGFDYLRDNMEYETGARRQRGLFFAIVDEVDSILIDEARTPLIISGPAEGSTDIYVAIDKIPDMLVRQKQEKGEGDYWVDEKQHTVQLSEAGHEKVEKIMVDMGLLPAGQSLYSPTNIMLLHYLNAALRAHTLFVKDQHYVVQNGEVIIVDEFTGRLMKGRRWSDGLHQAVEAKEGVEIQQENQTFASITFQNYFRMYEKLSGMTGTADTEAYEFQEIYGLETVVIPTHRMMIRDDQQDKVYRTAKEKYKAIVDDVKECYGRGQPVLVGTTSIENSELISDMLTKAGIPHNVLNAKQHEREAQIVMEAGRPGMVTIATNMAGHVGGNRNHAGTAGFHNDLSFSFMLLSIEHIMRNACFSQHVADKFGVFDRGRTDKNRLTAAVALFNVINDSFVFFFCSAIDLILLVITNHHAVCRDDNRFQTVNFLEFISFRIGRTGHTGELFIHTEVVLEGNRRKSLVFLLNFNAFFGFNGLMQTVGPTASFHQTTGEFVNDNDFAVLNDIVLVFDKERMSTERCIQIVKQHDVRRRIKALAGRQQTHVDHDFFDFLVAGFRKLNGVLLFINPVVAFALFLFLANQHVGDLVDRNVNIRAAFGRAGNNQRGSGLVNQNGVNFVHDREEQTSLAACAGLVLHIVAEVVKAEFIIRTVGNIGSVSGLLLIVRLIGKNRSDTHSKEVVNLTHPCRVTACQVIVHGHDVRTFTGQCVEVNR